MNNVEDHWQQRVAEFWQRADTDESMPPDQLVAEADALAAERPTGDATAFFERASARDRVGREMQAAHYYRAALGAGGLDPYRNARAVIQLASTLRILGHLDESERLLIAELDRAAEGDTVLPLRDEARAFLALTYVAQGRGVEAAGLALSTLAPHLTRYRRSVAGNAAELFNDVPLYPGAARS